MKARYFDRTINKEKKRIHILRKCEHCIKKKEFEISIISFQSLTNKYR